MYCKKKTKLKCNKKRSREGERERFEIVNKTYHKIQFTDTWKEEPNVDRHH